MTQSGSVSNQSSVSNSNGRKKQVKNDRSKNYHGKRKSKKESYKNKQSVNSKTSSRYSGKCAKEDVVQHYHGGKKPQRNDDTDRVRLTSKKRDKNHFLLSVDTSKREFSMRRENEIAQCIRVFSNKNFKILKREQYTTSYGFIRNQKLLGIPNCKFIIDIPLDYPHSSVKLHYGNIKLKCDKTLEEKLDTLIKNFNLKSIQLVARGEPIISQLNYLVEKAEILSRPDYESIDKREQIFFSQFA